MNSYPLVSFIVLSYNYEKYIPLAIKSIISQTIQDFEIVIVDDSSTDLSCEVIRSFGDSRIHLLRNDNNIGGAASYNRAVEAARGKYLANLDADDWIYENKLECQLSELHKTPVDILGTYSSFVDADGNKHPQASDLEKICNQQHDLNDASNWIGRNNLVRSTTMVDRAAHIRIGLDDPAMESAPDFELWTRALRKGCRFGILPQELTYYRVHSRGVTHQKPRSTFFEMSYATFKNILPIFDKDKNSGEIENIIQWIYSNKTLFANGDNSIYHVLYLYILRENFSNFSDFIDRLKYNNDIINIYAASSRLLDVIRTVSKDISAPKLQAELTAVSQARDFWKQQSDAWENQANSLQVTLQVELTAVLQARDFWKQQSDAWEEEALAAAGRDTPRI